MATLHDDEKFTSSLSEEAYDLISCFYNGIDEVVYSVAEQVAKERLRNSGGQVDLEQPILIEIEDVREAGKRVIAAVQHLVELNKMPAEMMDALGGMKDCFECGANDK